MHKLFTTTFMLLYTTMLFAQQTEPGAIKGVIYDQTGKGVSGAGVGILSTNYGTFSGTEGNFHIENITPGTYELMINAVSYKMKKYRVEIEAGQTHEVEIELEERSYAMPQVNIFAERNTGIFNTVPGALTYINKEEIDKINALSSNEVLRRSSGVHVVEEEGAGMRMNLAIRGLDAARSRSTLILEDGIPLALAPYGEPEMYYAPAMEKMDGVEILKGSGSVLYGPQTIGGVVNFITKDPPPESSGELNLKGGQGGFFSSFLSYGTTAGKAGVQVNYLHKRADNLGPTMFRLHDLSSKMKFQLNDNSFLGVKVGVYNEFSNSTYVGMTQPMYESGIYDFQPISDHDRLDVARYNLSATHDYYFNDDIKLSTTLFGYTTTRNWGRQDFTYNRFDPEGNLRPKPDNYDGVTLGDESVEAGAIYLLSTSGNRNRTYHVGGVESRININYRLGTMDNEFTGGLRYLGEQAFEQRINGDKPDARSGQIMNDEVRTGHGYSSYAHNRFNITRSFSVTAGARIEVFNDKRDIRRARYEINDEMVVRDTSVIAHNSLTEVIPGAGFNLQVTDDFVVFGGVHRGFAPPRTKDAISNSGEVYELDAEKSWNYELGIRAKAARWIQYEVTGFFMDFSNQVIPVAEHAGGVGAGITNGGATLHTGVETGVLLDFGTLFNWEQMNVQYDVNAAFINARFNSERYMTNHQEVVENVKGNRTPYSPEWLVSSALSLEHVNTGLATRVNLTYVSGQYTDPFNTMEPLNNGREGYIPAYEVIDVSVFYTIERINTTVNISAKNLINKRYITSRRPQGIKLGNPRIVSAGVRYGF